MSSKFTIDLLKFQLSKKAPESTKGLPVLLYDQIKRRGTLLNKMSIICNSNRLTAIAQNTFNFNISLLGEDEEKELMEEKSVHIVTKKETMLKR